MRLVYLAHPYGGNPENLARAKRWLAWAIREYPGCAFVANWILEGELFPETPEERKAGLRRDEAVLARCDELWLVGGEVSPGMEAEAQAAMRNGVHVHDRHYLGKEPPR